MYQYPVNKYYLCHHVVSGHDTRAFVYASFATTGSQYPHDEHMMNPADVILSDSHDQGRENVG